MFALSPLILIYSLYFIISKTDSKFQKQSTTCLNKTKNLNNSIPLLQWAFKHHIYIHPSLSFNKNKFNDTNHNFHYFTTNSVIPNGTLLFKISSNMILSQKNIYSYFKKVKNIKRTALWEEINSLKELQHFSAKELLYLTTIISDAALKGKGHIFKKYCEYLKLYEYINLDHFPLYYLEKEIFYLNHSNFGREIKNYLALINKEYSLIKINNNFNKKIQIEDFLKFRTILSSNNINFNNSTYIIPLIDCFIKKINSTKINTNFKFILNSKNEFDFEVYSTDIIKKNEKIYMQWKTMPNDKTLLFYGFIDENNLISPNYYVKILNENYQNDLKSDKINKTELNLLLFDLVKTKNYYDLNFDFFGKKIVDIYSNISKYYQKYLKYHEGAYLMMKDNLNYYLKMYNEKYDNLTISRYIDDKIKKDQIKNILNIEKRLIKNRIKFIDDVIKDIQRTKEERDIVEKVIKAREEMELKNQKNIKI